MYRLSFLFLLFFPVIPLAMDLPVENFPLGFYPQEVTIYLCAKDKTFEKPLLSPTYQDQQLKEFYRHYYSSTGKGLSPWNGKLVEAILPFVKEQVPQILENFNNEHATAKEKHYGENFQLKNHRWWQNIRTNIDLPAITSAAFNVHNRAITVKNTFARALPDCAPDFFHPSLPGQGFPFDNLQMSSIWAGTPLYVISVSKDKAWSLVLTPDSYFGWINSEDLAYASPTFMRNWQAAARHRLGAITQTGATIVDAHDHFQLAGYIGAVFPIIHQYKNDQVTLLIPIKDENRQAKIAYGYLPNESIVTMPLPASKKSFAQLLEELTARPYGWGGAFLFNDCSQEMKSLFTPFGIWLRGILLSKLS